jgi:hypothetical protein
MTVHVNNKSVSLDALVHTETKIKGISKDDSFLRGHQILSSKPVNIEATPTMVNKPLPRDDSFETIIASTKTNNRKIRAESDSCAQGLRNQVKNNQDMDLSSINVFGESPQFSKLKELIKQVTDNLNESSMSSPSKTTVNGQISSIYETDLVDKFNELSFNEEVKNKPQENEIVVAKSIGTDLLPNTTRVFISNSNNPSEFIVSLLNIY